MTKKSDVEKFNQLCEDIILQLDDYKEIKKEIIKKNSPSFKRRVRRLKEKLRKKYPNYA